jgi:predicted RND superfamily exporter protein
MVAVIGATVFFASQIFKIEMKFDPKDILPQNHPYVQLNNKIEEKFGGSRVVVMGIVAKKGDIFSPEGLKKVAAMTEEVKRINGIKEENLVSLSDRKVKYIKATPEGIEVTRLMEKVPETPEEAAEFKKKVFSNDLFVNSIVSADGSAAAIITDFRSWIPPQEGAYSEGGQGPGAQGSGDWKKWQKGGGQGQMGPGSFPQGQGAQGPAPQGEQGFGSGPSGNFPAQGGQSSPDPQPETRNSKLETSSSPTTCPSWLNKDAPGWLPDSLIYCQMRDIGIKYQDENYRVYLGGMPVVLHFFSEDAFKQLFFLFPLAILIIGLLHWYAFRTWQGLIIPLMTALLSVVWAMGIMGLSGRSMDPWNAMTPILILAIAAGHSVQILKRYYEEYDRLRAEGRPADRSTVKEAVVASTTQVGIAMVTAGLIASASFASLITFKLKTFQSFGLLTAFGILSALFLELTFIPALRSILRPSKKVRAQKGPDLLDRFLDGLGQRVAGSGRPAILAIAGVVALLALAGASRVQISNSNRSQFFESTVLRQDEKVLNAKFGGTSTVYLLVESKKPDALKDPKVLASIDGLQRELEKMEGVGKTESYVDYLKKMNKSLNGGDPAFDRPPDRQDLAAQYLFLYSVSGNPTDFARLIDAGYSEAVVWIFLKSDDTRLAERLIRVVDNYKKNHFDPDQIGIGVAGSSPVVVALNEEMVRGKIWNIVQIASITLLITALVRRSLLGGLFVMVPLALAVIVNFGLMGLTGITLGIGTAAISAMAVGIGADYEIYLIFRMREELQKTGNLGKAVINTLKTSGKAIIFVAVAVSAGYALLAFTGYYLHMEGILVPLAMLTACLGALTILPALVMIARPRFVLGPQGEKKVRLGDAAS